MKVRLPTHDTQRSIDLPATFVATERERQLTTAHWAPGSRVCPLRAVSRRQLTFPSSVAPEPA